MQLDSLIPQTPTQWFGLTVATLLAALSGWWARRKREPIELEKLRAETKSIHVTAETAEINLGRDLMREMREVVDKAETRRVQWYEKEDQLRGQIVFWRNKSEELDGQLADAQETIWKMQSEMKNYENQIVQMRATLNIKDTNYDNSKHLPPSPIDKPED